MEWKISLMRKRGVRSGVVASTADMGSLMPAILTCFVHRGSPRHAPVSCHGIDATGQNMTGEDQFNCCCSRISSRRCLARLDADVSGNLLMTDLSVVVAASVCLSAYWQ